MPALLLLACLRGALAGHPVARQQAAIRWRSGRSRLAAAATMSVAGRPRVLCLDSDGVARELAKLAGYDVRVENGISDKQVEALLSSSGFAALVLRSANTCSVRTLDAAGGAFRIVGRAGIGLDNIDIVSCKARGIEVLNTPTASVGSVAELTLTLMLSLMRRLPEARDSLLAGKWDRARLEGSSLCGKRLGVLGYGAIGQRVSELARAFGMHVCTLSSSSNADKAMIHGVELLSLGELLSSSDVVSLHMPSLPGGVPLIDDDALRVMKCTAILVNTGRGTLVDETALLAALERGELGGAGLDVFSREGAPLDPRVAKLVAHPRVIATPHTGGSTVEAREAISSELAARLHAALSD